jgi:tRNA A37 threonylcarbamoyladenosine synthetase subunit TsaC/SUA5/YrdC
LGPVVSQAINRRGQRRALQDFWGGRLTIIFSAETQSRGEIQAKLGVPGFLCASASLREPSLRRIHNAALDRVPGR